MAIKHPIREHLTYKAKKCTLEAFQRFPTAHKRVTVEGICVLLAGVEYKLELVKSINQSLLSVLLWSWLYFG